MANIRQAFEYAAKNPNSDFAKNLEKQAASGALDVEAKKYGIDLTPFKPVQQHIPTLGEKVVGNAKAALGGVASGVGGAILTAQDILGRKIVNALPENTTIAGVTKQQMQQNLANAPKLQEQLKKEFGGDTYNSASEVGQVAGEIATLAAPVGAIGKTIQKATKSVGGSNLVSKLAQAGAEGVAFTAGQGVIRNEKQSLNDFALNAGLNMVFPAAGSVAKKVGENAPARIINSLIKPLQKDFAYGKNPGRTVAELGITANDFDGLITGIKNAKTSVGENIGTLTQKALPQLQSQMDLNTYLTPIDEALAIANKSPRTNATVISRLESVKADLVDNVNRGIDPQSFKGLVGDLTRWTGNASDDAIVNKALKQVYGKTSSGMDTVLKDTLSPEEFVQYKKNAEQYGDLISAENAAVYRDSIVKRQDLVSFGAKNSALITAVAAAASSGGSGLGTILAGLGGAVLDKAMATPAFKTRLASLLTKLAPKDINTFFDKIPVAKTLYRQEQIEDIIKTAKKNYKGQMNKGMVNFSEIKKTFTPSKTITNDISKAKASGQSFDEWVKGQGTTEPINKTQFVEKTKGQFNSIREVGGYKVRARMYDNNPWQIVDDAADIGDGDSFRTSKTIKEFRTREDLWKYIKDNPKGQDLDLVKAKNAILQSPTLSKAEIETIKSAISFDEIWDIVKTKGADTQGMFTTRLKTAFEYGGDKTSSQLKAEWDKVK